MQVVKARCPHCGNMQSMIEDVNLLKFFCKKCSAQRRALAEEYFHSRETIKVHNKYLISKRKR